MDATLAGNARVTEVATSVSAVGQEIVAESKLAKGARKATTVRRKVSVTKEDREDKVDRKTKRKGLSWEELHATAERQKVITTQEVLCGPLRNALSSNTTAKLRLSSITFHQYGHRWLQVVSRIDRGSSSISSSAAHALFHWFAVGRSRRLRTTSTTPPSHTRLCQSCRMLHRSASWQLLTPLQLR